MSAPTNIPDLNADPWKWWKDPYGNYELSAPDGSTWSFNPIGDGRYGVSINNTNGTSSYQTVNAGDTIPMLGNTGGVTFNPSDAANPFTPSQFAGSAQPVPVDQTNVPVLNPTSTPEPTTVFSATPSASPTPSATPPLPTAGPDLASRGSGSQASTNVGSPTSEPGNSPTAPPPAGSGNTNPPPGTGFSTSPHPSGKIEIVQQGDGSWAQVNPDGSAFPVSYVPPSAAPPPGLPPGLPLSWTDNNGTVGAQIAPGSDTYIRKLPPNPVTGKTIIQISYKDKKTGEQTDWLNADQQAGGTYKVGKVYIGPDGQIGSSPSAVGDANSPGGPAGLNQTIQPPPLPPGVTKVDHYSDGSVRYTLDDGTQIRGKEGMVGSTPVFEGQYDNNMPVYINRSNGQYGSTLDSVLTAAPPPPTIPGPGTTFTWKDGNTYTVGETFNGITQVEDQHGTQYEFKTSDIPSIGGNTNPIASFDQNGVRYTDGAVLTQLPNIFGKNAASLKFGDGGPQVTGTVDENHTFHGKWSDGTPFTMDLNTEVVQSGNSSGQTRTPPSAGTDYANSQITQTDDGGFNLHLPESPGNATRDISLIPVDENGKPITVDNFEQGKIYHFADAQDLEVKIDGWWETKDVNGTPTKVWQTGWVHGDDTGVGFGTKIWDAIAANPKAAALSFFALASAMYLGYQMANGHLKDVLMQLLLGGAMNVYSTYEGLYQFLKNSGLTNYPGWTSIGIVAAVMIIGFLLAKLPKWLKKTPNKNDNTTPVWYQRPPFADLMGSHVFMITGATALLGGALMLGPGAPALQGPVHISGNNAAISALNSELHSATGGAYTGKDAPVGKVFIYAVNGDTQTAHPASGVNDRAVFLTRTADGGYNVNVVSLDYNGIAVGFSPPFYGQFFTVSGGQVVPAPGAEARLDTQTAMLNAGGPASPVPYPAKLGAMHIGSGADHITTFIPSPANN